MPITIVKLDARSQDTTIRKRRVPFAGLAPNLYWPYRDLLHLVPRRERSHHQARYRRSSSATVPGANASGCVPHSYTGWVLSHW